MKDKLMIFLKGMLMGICDIIPGISGGTIAFITGIYERLINAVKNIDIELLKDLFNFRFVQILKRLDIVFLITLLFGIGASFLIGSRIIGNLLENHFVLTISFFIGLIASSALLIFEKIDKRSGFWTIVGLILGVSIAFFSPNNVLDPTLINIAFGGFFAISAMFLPGISGAFILLIMGLYEFMLDVLHNIFDNIPYFIAFVIGAGLGAIFISRIISALFKKRRNETLSVLLGLVLGALSIPVKRIMYSDFEWSLVNSLFVIALLSIGIFSVLIVNNIQKKKRKIKS